MKSSKDFDGDYFDIVVFRISTSSLPPPGFRANPIEIFDFVSIEISRLEGIGSEGVLLTNHLSYPALVSL